MFYLYRAISAGLSSTPGQAHARLRKGWGLGTALSVPCSDCLKTSFNHNVFQIPDDAPIMFTRLDSERNAKVMKRALNERRLSQETYEVRNIIFDFKIKPSLLDALIFTTANLRKP